MSSSERARHARDDADTAPALQIVAPAPARPRRRWYDRVPTWRWFAILIPAVGGAVVAVTIVGTGLLAFLLVTAVFVLVPPACAVAVVSLLISAWRTTPWHRRVLHALLAVLPALLLYECATAYDRVMSLFFAGQH